MWHVLGHRNHDGAMVERKGWVARGRVDNDASGFPQLLTLLAEAADTRKSDPGRIESRGRWVAALRDDRAGDLRSTAGRVHHRACRGVGREIRCQRGCCMANIVRTDRDRHRVFAPDQWHQH